jgi:hypothetical protein
MATTAALETDTPVDVLAAMRDSRAVADREEAKILDLAATWASMHSPDPLPREDGAPMFGDRLVRIAGEGAPEVLELCVAEVAAVLHISTEAGRNLLAEAVELRHRLPRVWARVHAGELRRGAPAGSPSRRCRSVGTVRRTPTGTWRRSPTGSASHSSTGWSRRRSSASSPRVLALRR